MNIIFKDVGQGDSIIIEWADNGQEKIGIVDAHLLSNGLNPVLEHLKVKMPDEIEFIILSHGHYDHCSGLSEVLDFCKAKGIRICKLFHTLSGKSVQIFSKESRTKKRLSLELLFDNFIKYTDEGENKIIDYYDDIKTVTPDIRLNDDIFISVLSPTKTLLDKLDKDIGRYIGGYKGSVPNINKASTILKITKGDEYVLLVADSTISKMSKIEPVLEGHTMLLGQVPHHGSIYNHRLKFWENISRSKDCKAVFSVGVNHSDKLPDEQVVRELNNLKYIIHSTNQVFGVSDVFGSHPNVSEDVEVIDDVMDLFIEDDPVAATNGVYDNLNGDQRFSFW